MGVRAPPTEIRRLSAQSLIIVKHRISSGGRKLERQQQEESIHSILYINISINLMLMLHPVYNNKNKLLL